MLDPTSVPPMADERAQQDSPDDDPIPLTQPVQIPPFPVDSLPKPVADMVKATAEATQTDPAMAGTSALSAMSACTGGHAEI
jgi:replicative DNA helicase